MPRSNVRKHFIAAAGWRHQATLWNGGTIAVGGWPNRHDSPLHFQWRALSGTAIGLARTADFQELEIDRRMTARRTRPNPSCRPSESPSRPVRLRSLMARGAGRRQISSLWPAEKILPATITPFATRMTFGRRTNWLAPSASWNRQASLFRRSTVRVRV